MTLGSEEDLEVRGHPLDVTSPDSLTSSELQNDTEREREIEKMQEMSHDEPGGPIVDSVLEDLSSSHCEAGNMTSLQKDLIDTNVIQIADTLYSVEDTAKISSTSAVQQIVPTLTIDSRQLRVSGTVIITAGGITATVSTSDQGIPSATTAPAVITPHSSITCPDLSAGVFPRTGVAGRSETLPQLRISSLNNYLLDEEESRIHAMTPLQVVYEGGTGLTFSRPTPANVIRKCVYMYEDKYSFCRVLQPGMLLFDSHFECGNLHSAYLVTSNRDSDRSTSGAHLHSFYDLYMHEDVTAAAGAQWFYFSVSGNKLKQKVTFSIRNFYKQESLFNEGMRPLMLSLKGVTSKSGEKRQGWTRAGYNISYRQETQEEYNNNPAPASNTSTSLSSAAGASGSGSGKRSKKAASAASRGFKSVLTFTHIFDEAQDTCFFAFCHPYTYTDLQTHLFIAEGKLQQSAARSTLSPRPVVYSKVPAAQESSSASVGQGGSKLLFYYRTKLCDTLAGNRCDLLVISSLDNVQLRENDPAVGASVSDFSDPAPPSGVTNAPIQMPTPPLSRSSTPSSQRSPSPSTSARSVKASAMDYYPIPGLATPKSVPHIIISARVHPGETTASWSMQGFLDFILSNHLKAQELREKFVFIIVPMLNPDGVINGNNRTSLSGHDLNRNWRCPDPVRHPTIHHLKTVAQNLVDRTSHEVLMYLDLHGHSRQKGAFTYGCLPDKDDIQQIREFFSAAPTMSTLSGKGSCVAAQSQATLAGQPSSSTLKGDNSLPISNVGKGVPSSEHLHAVVFDQNMKGGSRPSSAHHVGTRGILSRGRTKVDGQCLGGSDDGGDQSALLSSPRRGQLCGDYDDDDARAPNGDDGNIPVHTVTAKTIKTVRTFAPVLLRPASPIVKQNSVTCLEDATLSMNIDVNFDGYSNNNMANMLYSNRGASLETENDKNIMNAFACGGELEQKFGSKEERVKSLPRIFMKRMLSFTQSHCSYKVPSAKLSTSRAVMALEVGIECSYTLEISLAGDSKKLFQPTDLLNIGKAMGKSLHDWMHPALALLETKRLLEEQERVRQEQLEAYFDFNNKNKDRESRKGSRSRPHSACASKTRLTASNSRGPSTATTTTMMMDLDSFVNINSIQGPPVRIRGERSKTRGQSASPLTLEGQRVGEVERSSRQQRLPSGTERPPRDETKQSTGEKSGQSGGAESLLTGAGVYTHHASALNPTLHVRHALPEFIFDVADKRDILASPVEVQPSSTKRHATQNAKDIIPTLNLSIASLSQHHYSTTGGGSDVASARSRKLPGDTSNSNSISNSNSNSPIDRKRGGDAPGPYFIRSARYQSARKTDKELERESVAWDEHLLRQQHVSSPSKSPRPSSLKDSLKYAQNSSVGPPTPPRAVFQQKQQAQSPETRLRSESAKTRKSPTMVSAKVAEVDWEERDAQAATKHLKLKVTSHRLKKSSQLVDEGLIVETSPAQAQAPSSSAAPVSSKKKGGRKVVLADELDVLRREYEEESIRLLDDDKEERMSELNLQSNDPHEEQSSFPSHHGAHLHSTMSAKRSNRGLGVASNKSRRHMQQLESQQETPPPLQQEQGLQPPMTNFSMRIDGKKQQKR